MPKPVPVVVDAEETSDEDAEDKEDDAGSGDDDHRPCRADYIALFEVSLNKNWEERKRYFKKKIVLIFFCVGFIFITFEFTSNFVIY